MLSINDTQHPHTGDDGCRPHTHRPLPQIHRTNQLDHHNTASPTRDVGLQIHQTTKPTINNTATTTTPTGDVGRERVRDGLLEVVEDEAALLDAADDGGEVVVEQDHVGRLLGHGAAHDAHGDADVRLLQGRRVVHAVSRHGHDVAAALYSGFILFYFLCTGWG